MKRALAALAVSFSLCALSAPNSCPPLKERISVTEIDLPEELASVESDNPATFWEAARIPQMVLSPQPNGGARVAWTSKVGHTIHVTPLDKNLKVTGEAWTIPGGGLRDMVAHDDGSAVLHFNRGRMVLTRLKDGAEAVLFQNRSLGAYSSSGIHMGSLSWDGTTYGTYYAVHNGGHEGDALSFISPNGSVNKRTWDWGCSHSIDQRLLVTNGHTQALCLVEAFPGHGLYLNNRHRVASIPGGGGGSTNGRIGGMAEVGDNLAIAYTHREGSGWQAKMVIVNKDRSKGLSILSQGHLPNNTHHETNIKIARLGSDKIVVSWVDPKAGTRLFWVYNSDATKMLESEDDTHFSAYGRSDFKTLANGDVAWLSVNPDPKKISVTRLKNCDTK